MAGTRWLSVVGCALAVALIASPLAAQEKKGGGRRGGGGFGGGAMFETTKLSLLNREQVQTELKITPEQKTKIEDLRKDLPAPGRGNRDATAEDRKAAAEKRQKEVVEAEKKLDGILKADQVKRLNEIYIQQKGAQALKDEMVVKELKITPEQTTKIDGVLAWAQSERQKLGGFGGDADARKKRMEESEKLRKETEEKAIATLTDDQKKQLEKLKGTPFKLEPLAFPAGGGGRGNRKGGNAGGGGSI